MGDFEPKKILVLRFSSLGDILMITPVVRCLRKRFPFAQIDFATREDFAPLLQHNPHIDQLLTISRGSGLMGLLRLRRRILREDYHLIYDAHQSLRSRFLMATVRGPMKRHFAKRYLHRNLALLFKIRWLDDIRISERVVQPLIDLGVVYDHQRPEMFFPKDFSAPEVDGITSSQKPLVGVVPSAQWPGKRYSPERFRTVIAELVSRGRHVAVFGGASDNFCQQITSGFPPAEVTNFQGKLDLLQAAWVLSRCQYVIANDTGLLHMADALGVPAVTIFGPTSKELGCLPFHPQGTVVEKQLWCRPCSKNGQAPCIRFSRACLDHSPSAVLDAALKLEASLQGIA